jgi:hypothetical protein
MTLGADIATAKARGATYNMFIVQVITIINYDRNAFTVSGHWSLVFDTENI